MHFSSKNALDTLKDIQSRKDANAAIANTVVNTVAPLALNSIMMVFYLVVMLRYSVPLTCIGMLSLVINEA